MEPSSSPFKMMSEDIGKIDLNGICNLSSRNFTIHFLCEFEEVNEDTERYVPDPGGFDEMSLSVEVVVYCNLDEVTGEMGTAR